MQGSRAAKLKDIGRKKCNGCVEITRDASSKLNSAAMNRSREEDEIRSVANQATLINEKPSRNDVGQEQEQEANINDCIRLIEEHSDYNTYKVTVDVIRPEREISSNELPEINENAVSVSKENCDSEYQHTDTRSDEEIRACLRKAFLLEPNRDSDYLNDDDDTQVEITEDEELVDEIKKYDIMQTELVSESEVGAGMFQTSQDPKVEGEQVDDLFEFAFNGMMN